MHAMLLFEDLLHSNLGLATTHSQINANYLLHHRMIRKSYCRLFSEDYVHTSVWSDTGSHVPHYPRFLRRKTLKNINHCFVFVYIKKYDIKKSSSTLTPSNSMSVKSKMTKHWNTVYGEQSACDDTDASSVPTGESQQDYTILTFYPPFSLCLSKV